MWLHCYRTGVTSFQWYDDFHDEICEVFAISVYNSWLSRHMFPMMILGPNWFRWFFFLYGAKPQFDDSSLTRHSGTRFHRIPVKSSVFIQENDLHYRLQYPCSPGGKTINSIQHSQAQCQKVNTLRPRQMAAIFQTTFSNAFSWMKMY